MAKIKQVFRTLIDWLTRLITGPTKQTAPSKPEQNLSNTNKAVLNQVLSSFLPISDINALKKTNLYLSKNIELTEKHKTIAKSMSEIKKIYPKQLIDAFGLENIAALPQLQDLIIADQAIRYYPRRDTEVYYIYHPIRISQLQGAKAIRGSSLQHDPLTLDSYRIGYLIYICNDEVVTICNQPGHYRSNNWVILRGETREASLIEDWSALGREFRQNDLKPSKSLVSHR